MSEREISIAKASDIALNIMGWCVAVLLVGVFILFVIILLTGDIVNSFSDIFVLKVFPLIGIIMILSCVVYVVGETDEDENNKRGERMNINVGVCETCKFYHVDYFDPSPGGVALSPGVMEDVYCEKEDEVMLTADDKDMGTDENHQCPFWQPAFQWCKRHKTWYMGECDKCLDEMAEELRVGD